jgi:hypothetical protein
MATAVKQTGVFSTMPAVINAGEALSTVVDCDGDLVSLIFPDDWTSSRATIQISADNIDYFNLYRMNGEEVEVEVIPGGAIVIDTDIARTIRYLKIRAGTNDQPVEQSEDRTFLVVLVTADTAPPAAARSSGAKAPAARRKIPRKTAKPRRKHR